MPSQYIDEESIFKFARKLVSLDDRNEYLRQVCGGDTELLARIEALLVVDRQDPDFLNSPPSGVAVTKNAFRATEQTGQVIGKYKLLEQIGEGGMGTVFMAEQTEPIKRRVALKIIKPGMDSEQVIARFEAERQALAMMDHPNIAKVLDAGITDSGRPYFVMELVKGLPIDQYCDEHNLSSQQRLELFVPVCHALQHAHHKGVVHRDIKPSNVLVAEFDNQAVPKVIDFGVAKAVEQQLTERTLFTKFGQVIGTPEYMSPEQAKMNQLDVDTRSDIYSLGVLLYELLTGTTPLDKQRLRSVAFDELLRIIREEEPPRPSVRLSTVDDLATVATHRRTEPRKLSMILRGDLDWIVMKALDKERSRRYDSANAMADDVERYLSGDAVVACPPSARYLLRKLAGRNKAAFVTAGVVSLSLVLGIVGTSLMAIKAWEAQQQALAALADLREQQEIAEDTFALLRDEVIEQAFLTIMLGDIQNCEQAIERVRRLKAGEATIRTLEGLAALYKGDLDSALQFAQHATESDPHNYAAWIARRLIYWSSGQNLMARATSTQMRNNGIDVQDGYGNDYELLMKLQMGWGPDKQLDELIARKPTWLVARLARAARLGTAEATREQLEQAVTDITLASSILPKTPLALTTKLGVHQAVLSHADDSNWDISDSPDLAEAAANALEEYPKYAYGRVVRMMYFRQTEQQDRANQEVEAALNLGFGGRWTNAVKAYGHDDQELAQQLFQAGPYQSGLTPIWLAFVEAEESPELALKAYRKIVESADATLRRRVEACAILLLIGASREYIQSELSRIDADFEGGFESTRSFLRGEIEPADFVDQHEHLWMKQDAHYWIGLEHLNQGNREKAIAHFERAVELFSPGWLPCHWSQAFLERLKDDPAWPARLQQ